MQCHLKQCNTKIWKVYSAVVVMVVLSKAGEVKFAINAFKVRKHVSPVELYDAF